MIYTPLIKKALKIAFAAHENQVDKGGIPYIFHPYEVAQQMTTEYEICTALLHDVIEDTDVTAEIFEPLVFQKSFWKPCCY